MKRGKEEKKRVSKKTKNKNKLFTNKIIKITKIGNAGPYFVYFSD